jgi:hypothetical protein
MKNVAIGNEIHVGSFLNSINVQTCIVVVPEIVALTISVPGICSFCHLSSWHFNTCIVFSSLFIPGMAFLAF